MTNYPNVVEHVRVHVGSPVYQDVTVILITKLERDKDGEVRQFYAREFVWQEYHGLDMLDVLRVSFPGSTRVVVEAPRHYEMGWQGAGIPSGT